MSRERSIVALAILAVLVAAIAAGEDRTYHPISVRDLATRLPVRAVPTHVEVRGVVQMARVERDGDVHVRLCDGGLCIVAEIVPEIPLKRPRRGSAISVRGISRWDGEHHWAEVHPVESWEVAR